MLRAIAMAALFTFAAGNAVWAQSQGDPKERAACRPDVMRFCKDLVKDKGEDVVSILNCLESNRSKISKPCSDVFASHGE